MSFRSTSRLAAPLRSAARATASRNTAVVARRAASTGGHAKPGSDTPWMLGSAAVFLPLGAWVVYRGKTEHAHGHAHPKEDPQQNDVQEDQHGRKGLDTLFEEPDHEKNKEKAEGNPGGAPNAEDAPGVNKEKQAAEQAKYIDTPKEAKAVAQQGDEVTTKAAAKATGQEETAEKKSADASDKKPASDDTKEDKADDKTEDKKEDKKESGEGDEPSAKEIKDSLHQAERAAVPRAALAEDTKDK